MFGGYSYRLNDSTAEMRDDCDEYVALCDASKDALFVQTDLTKIRVYIVRDNGYAKVIAENPSNPPKTKDIDVKLHFMKGIYRAGKVRVLHVG